ncbi:ankyrin repeat domain-containing protein [Spiroplasma sp. AdecLV25b]|uniref:ankyrin repeat domain-containing protein n=1 Tax=Spiroplasma sp. AdecLV25b TaxID=3027162 RepID=UPI0027E0E8CF|nr:ankyrin repeat domain-containing protein [Spiroplasma sp. AdecLV25b]
MEEKYSINSKNIIKERNDFIETLVKEKLSVNLAHLEMSRALKENQKIVSVCLEFQEEYVATINDSNEKLAVANNISKTKIILGFYDFFITTFKKAASTKKALFKKTTRSIVFEKIIFLLIDMNIKVGKNTNQLRKQFTTQINKMIDKIISLNKKYHYLKIEMESFQEISLIKLFYEIGVDFNQLLNHVITEKNKEIKYSPLHLAANSGNYELVRAILSWGVDINVVDGLGANALFIAAYQENIAIVKYLLANGANINILADDVSTIEMLIEKNNHEILQLLIDSGADVNIRDKNYKVPLYIAIETNNIKLIQLLIDNGADITNNNALLLVITAMISTPTVLKLLLNNGVDLNISSDLDNDVSLLHTVVTYKKNNFIKLLIEKGMNINSKDNKFGHTPLHTAIVNNNKEVAEILSTLGANVYIKDSKGQTPFYLTQKKKNFDFIKNVKN